MKLIMTIGLVILSIVLFGCGSGSGPDVHFTNFRTGSLGISMEFAEDMPPKEILEKSNAQIAVLVKNEGAADISNGILVLEVDETMITAEDTKKTYSINGRSEYNSKGEQESALFSITANEIKGTKDEDSTTVVVSSCYSYSTIAQTDACIDPDIYKQIDEEKACTTNERLKLAGAQGGPVAVTSIEERLQVRGEGDSQTVIPVFTIEIGNKGKGKVFRSGQEAKVCSSATPEPNTYNRVLVRAELSGTRLGCTPLKGQDISEPDGILLFLEKNDAKLLCASTQPIPIGAAAYSTTLVITLEYGYQESIKKEITVKNLANDLIENPLAKYCKDYGGQSKCNDFQKTQCDDPRYIKQPVPTDDCKETGCCRWKG